MMENLLGQEDTVATTNHHLHGTPVHVTPITLIGRFGPYPGGPPVEGGLPGNVDARQMSLLTAAWAVGTSRHFADAGAPPLTPFELGARRATVQPPGRSPSPAFPPVPRPA